jgi:hypothetical protein
MSLNEVTYGFVDENNIVINHGVFIKDDLETVNRVKTEYGAHAAYEVKDLSKEILSIGVNYWNGSRFIHPCPTALDGFIFDDESNSWISPIPYPEDENLYAWDKITKSWKTVQELGIEVPPQDQTEALPSDPV